MQRMSKFSSLLCFFIVALGFVSTISGSGHKLKIYEVKKHDFRLKVTNFGARIISVVLPDKNGKLGDVVLGYDSLTTYMNDSSNFGAIVGRVANRIGGAQFTLNGKRYKLDANDNNNTLHGGSKGFSQRIWKIKKYEKDLITLSYHSADGEEGFPGGVDVSVTYALLHPYKLKVIMTAKALNKATPVNLAQHAYWNLGNHNSGDILSDRIQIFASRITPVDKQLIPTGELSSVKGTPYDFLEPHVIGTKIHGLPNGYDINYALDGGDEKMKLAAIVKSNKSGREMKLYTDAPGVQFYTANSLSNVKGKDGYVYQPQAALCLETQGFPDSVNHPNFPSQIVNPGETYAHHMLFSFSIDKQH